MIVLVVSVVVDFTISSKLRKNRDNRILVNWNQIYEDSTFYDLVVMGSSRAWVQYNPLILDSILSINTFNLGMDGSAVNRQIIKYEKFSSIHNTPTCIVQNIDYATMDITRGYDREQFFPYFFYDRQLMRSYDIYEKFSFAEKNIPCFRYFGYSELISELILGHKKYKATPLIKGYNGREELWDGLELEKLDKVECCLNKKILPIYKDFLVQQKQNGVQIIFVYAPLYYKALEKMTHKEEMYKMFQDLALQFDIPILNYLDMPICYDTTYFYNATHLNRVGAEIFTTRLANDIDSLGVFKE